MTLKVKVNDPLFQYQLRVSKDACLVQIWRFQFKSVASYRAGKVKFTNGRTERRTDRWTDTDNNNTPSAWKGKNSVLILRSALHVAQLWPISGSPFVYAAARYSKS